MKSVRLISNLVALLVGGSAYAQIQGIPGATAVSDGCSSGSTTLPHYVTVKSANPPPDGLTGWIRYSHVASSDSPLDHDWHDFNFYVALDGNMMKTLNSQANYLNKNSFLEYSDSTNAGQNPWQTPASGWLPNLGNELLMEVEWDSSHVPQRFWASAGDRVWLKGRYIWDCGHPDPDPTQTTIANGSGYHTETHPPRAIALTRLEPYKFLDRSTGVRDSGYSLTTKTYVYINGNSGLRNLTSNGTTAVVSGNLDVPVATEDYKFEIDLPAKPNGVTGNPYYDVVDLPFGGPSPVLGYNSSTQKVTVTYPLNLGDTNPNLRFGAVIAAGWRQPPGVTFRTVTVGIHNVAGIGDIEIHDQHNPLCQSNWELWIAVNGEWRKIKGTAGLCVGSTITVNQQWTVVVPEDPSSRINVEAVGWVSVYDAVFGSPNDITRLLGEPTQAEQALGGGNVPFEDKGKIGFVFEHFTLKRIRDDLQACAEGPGKCVELASRHAEELDGDLGDPGFSSTARDFVIKNLVVQIH